MDAAAENFPGGKVGDEMPEPSQISTRVTGQDFRSRRVSPHVKPFDNSAIAP